MLLNFRETNRQFQVIITIAVILCVPALYAPAALQAAPPDTISTYAGGGPNNIAAITANVPYPLNAAIDKHGNFYFVTGSGSGSASQRVYEVNTAGVLTVVAGNGFAGYAGDGGPATQAELNGPSAIAVDSAGNIYIANPGSCNIRKVTASTGMISTFAGNGNYCGNGGDGGPATSAYLNSPTGVAVDGLGNVYIADTENSIVREVAASTGNIKTIAGSGAQGFGGDGGPATSAELDWPSSVAVDGSGNVYIADQRNYRIRKVTASTAKISTIAGNGSNGYSGNGVAGTGAEISAVYGVASDPSGNVFLADSQNCLVREVNAATGIITNVAGTPGHCGFAGDGGAATSAELQIPNGVAVDSSDNVYIADNLNFRIRKAAAGGNITTVAGNGSRFYAAGATALEASLAPQGAAPDASGNVYIADTANCNIRKVAGSTGDITTAAGVPPTCGYSGDGGTATSALLNNPTKVILDSSDNIYIADANNCVIRKITAGTGDISTVAGTPQSCGYRGDSGAATSAELNNPQGIALDSTGNLYIADSVNQVVRKVTASTGMITTVAGNHGKGSGYSGDGGPATGAQLNNPVDVAVDAHSNLYIVDSNNSRIRIVNSSGIINTFAGNGTSGYSGDGGPAAEAALRGPLGVAIDGAGDILISDSINQRVRWVDGQGIIYTLAGNGTNGFSGDGGPATSASLSLPEGVSADTYGNIYVGDSNNFRIRQVTAIANLNSSTYSLTFPQQIIGSTSAAQPVTLTGVGQLSISSIETTGDFAQTNNCPTNLTSDTSCAADVTFKPSSTGTRTGTLTISTNGFFNPTITVNLEGTGAAAGGLTFAPTVLYLGGEVIGGTSSSQTVTFTNGSAAAVTFSSATTSSSVFAVASNTCTGALAVGKTCTIGVTFKPTASGAATGTLAVKDSDSSSPQSIPLHGTGFATSISPQRLAFGTVSEGSTKTLGATLTNKGTASLTSISATVTGANGSDFTYTTTCGATLAEGASCSYSVTFKPTTTGAESATLNIKDNEEPNPGFAVALSGNG